MRISLHTNLNCISSICVTSSIFSSGSDGTLSNFQPAPPDIQVDSGADDLRQDNVQASDDSESHGEQAREKRLSSESINEQRMICGNAHKGDALAERNNPSAASTTTNKSRGHQEARPAAAAATAGMRLKRFSSSALCLNDSTAPTPEAIVAQQQERRGRSGKSHATTAGQKKKKRPPTVESKSERNQASAASGINSATGTPKKSSSKKSSANTLAPAPDTLDPIIQYARQRRPSVSNQGTLNVDQQALFSAVECNQLERVKSILDGGTTAAGALPADSPGSGDAPKVNVNSLNGDKLTCLDVAVLLRNLDMVRLLQAYGAKESSACLARDGRENQLYALYMEARRLVEDLSRSLDAIGGSAPIMKPPVHSHLGDPSGDFGATNLTGSPAATSPIGADQQQTKPQQLMLATGSLLSSALFEEKKRQLAYWRRRLDLFMQMRYGFEKLAVPNAPELVVLQVVGESSLGVKIVYSLQLSRQPATFLNGFETNGEIAAPSAPSGGGQCDYNQSTAISAGQAQRKHRKPLRKLVARAQERNITCPLGVACSHWLMDEFVVHKHQSEQFQMPSMASDGEPPARELPGAGNSRGPTEFKTVKLARQRGAASNANSVSQQRQHQEKLAIFNQLLAQQLTILSNQQRQQQRLELINNSRYRISANHQKSACQQVATRPPRIRPQHLLCTHQSESTDSAYDNLAAAAASSRQQQQQARQLSTILTVQATSSLQFSASPTGLAGCAPKGAHDSQPATGSGFNQQQQQHHQPHQQHQPYRSLAYQLMSARKRYSPAEGSSPQVSDSSSLPVDARDSNRGAVETEVELQSPDYEVADGTDGPDGLVQVMSKPASIITKYLVEWSLDDSFESLAGSMIIYNTNCYPLECQIEQLKNGCVYFVRVASGNHKGFSGARPTTPACLAPSSWRQVIVDGAASQAARKRLKYDEEVFRKFTKLILLNRHILDKSQIQMLQREQQSLLAPATCGRGRPDLLKSGNFQNKSSLINMLLLDATLPATGVTTAGRKTKQNQTQASGGGGGLSMANKLPVLDVIASSARGSLYPSSTSTRASVTGVGDTLPAGHDTSDSSAGGEQQQQTSLRMRKNLKSFFQSNSAKFNKLNNQNKRGLYLTTVVYCSSAGSCNGRLEANDESFNFHVDAARPTGTPTNRKLLVTNDDRLPVIEILNDLVAPSSLMADFYWLLKINGTNWIDIKRLRQQLQKSHSSSTLHLRIKLLAAIEQMQVALNLEDIGRLFYKPIVAHDGSIVICTCRCVSSTKQVSNLSIKWTSQQKIIPRHLRNISDAIAFSAQQREKQLEMQLKRNQQQRHHSTGVGTGGQDEGSILSDGQPMQAVNLGTSNCSSAHSSGEDPLTATSSTPTTENLTSTSQHTSTAINLITSTWADKRTDETTCEGLNRQAEVGSKHPLPTTNNRLLSASNAQIAMMPPELARLCETCQQALVQRRCLMASGSSSSSLASSQESQSWSSSQFSLASQQMIGTGQRSCTCSRSNSANPVLAPIVQPGQGTPAGQQQYPCSLGANTSSLASHMVATSAPASQRNSTHSARSTSGSMSMMMMMMMMGGGGGAGGGGGGGGPNTNQSTPHYYPTSGSFSLVQSGGGTTPSSGGAGSPSGVGQTQRQTQSQQLTEAAAPQKSSTFLMLASLGLYDLLLFHLSEIVEFDEASTRPLPRGLYLGFVQLQTTVESMRLLVPRRRPNMVPCARIRDNAHVSREEWHLLKKFPLISDGLRSEERGQVATGGCASSRSSDPAIWSLDSPLISAQQGRQDDNQPARAHVPNLLGLGPGAGFERDRAKSVSPGLIKCVGGRRAAQLEIREARVGACASLARNCQRHSSSSSALEGDSPAEGEHGQQHAHSDTDLAVQDKEVDLCPAEEVQAALITNERSNSDSNPTLASVLDLRPEGMPQGGSTHASRTSRHVPGSLEHSPEMTFVRLIGDAARRLLSELNSQLPKHFDNEHSPNSSSHRQHQHQHQELVSVLNSLNDKPNNRIYHLELIELSNQVTFVLMIPAPENVCPVTSHDRSNILANNRDFMLLPLQIFETIHLATYEPDLLGKYSRLSTILETDLIVAQHEHRQAFSSSELKSTKSRVSHLQDMVAIADEFWRQLRWIVDVVSFARDKSQLGQPGANTSTGCLRLATIWRHFDQLPMLANRASITSASTIANLCCIESACLTAAAAAAAANATPTARQLESGLPSEEEDDEQTPRARTNSVGDNLRCGAVTQASGRQGDQARGAGHAELKRTSSAKRACTASPMPPRRLPEIQLPSGDPPGEAHGARCQLDGPGERVRAPLVLATISPPVSLDEDESILDVEFGAPSRGPAAGRSDQQHAFQVGDEEAAIYAYHISLRDATRAAAQRKSLHQQQQQQQQQRQTATTTTATVVGSLFDDHSSVGANALSADDQLALTCGGLNLDRRQFEKFAAAAAAMAAATANDLSNAESLSSSSCASGHVTAYKCSARDSASHSSSSAALARPDGDRARESGALEEPPKATQGGHASRPTKGRTTTRMLKSTNPFLTDSFDL